MPRIPGASFRIDPTKKPAFERNTAVTLTKDYTKLPELGPCSKYLKKGVNCAIKDCAIFGYTFDDETQDFTNKISEMEWCEVEIGTPIFDPDEEEDYVMAKDLIEYFFE